VANQPVLQPHFDQRSQHFGNVHKAENDSLDHHLVLEVSHARLLLHRHSILKNLIHRAATFDLVPLHESNVVLSEERVELVENECFESQTLVHLTLEPVILVLGCFVAAFVIDELKDLNCQRVHDSVANRPDFVVDFFGAGLVVCSGDLVVQNLDHTVGQAGDQKDQDHNTELLEEGVAIVDLGLPVL